MEDYPSSTPISTKRTQARVVQMNKYFYARSCMLMSLSFATENKEDCIYHLLNYHLYKDEMQKHYFKMSQQDKETVLRLLVL